MTIPIRYRAEPAAELIVRPLDDITLIYHRRSGQTHMVMSPVPEILAVMHDPYSCESRNPESEVQTSESSAPGPLRSQGYYADDILALLAEHYEVADPTEALPAISAHLDEMAALGLVHRA